MCKKKSFSLQASSAFRDIVKSSRVRGTREEMRKRGAGESFAARSCVLVRLASLTQIGELASRLEGFLKLYPARLTSAL